MIAFTAKESLGKSAVFHIASKEGTRRGLGHGPPSVSSLPALAQIPWQSGVRRKQAVPLIKRRNTDPCVRSQRRTGFPVRPLLVDLTHRMDCCTLLLRMALHSHAHPKFALYKSN